MPLAISCYSLRLHKMSLYFKHFSSWKQVQKCVFSIFPQNSNESNFVKQKQSNCRGYEFKIDYSTRWIGRFSSICGAFAILNFEHGIIYFLEKRLYLALDHRVPCSDITLHVISLHRPVLVRTISFTEPPILKRKAPIFYGIRCESDRFEYLVSRDRLSWYRR